MPNSQLTFKIASLTSEFEQIHQLNYRTFVEEIPQHPPNTEKKLIDKFHEENLYCICLDGQHLVGMLAVRSNRPFSLDDKVPDLDKWLPPATSLCELRLLSVEPQYRCTYLFAGLLHFAATECIQRGYTLAVASGTLRQTRLYKRMGFIPFAEVVGSSVARYQPMYLTLSSGLSLLERLRMPEPELPAMTSFLPGPVEVSATVREVFSSPAVSHRSESFMRMVGDTQRLLCNLTGARYVELFLGSGTLVNDVVAAHLKVMGGTGVVLSNGEFGERLIDHASRMGLKFEVVRASWGHRHDMDKIEQLIMERQSVGWLWTTHCETSCGVLNDLRGLVGICRRRAVKLCMDCTSSLGTTPLDLSEVFLASSVSGKGLASFPGIGLVFYNNELEADNRLPRYLDLGYYRKKQGVPFTQSSNLVAALHQALLELNPAERFGIIRQQHDLIQRELSACGFSVLAAGDSTAPAVISIHLSADISSLQFGEAMERQGFLLSYRSEYLLERNIIQICLMGKIIDDQCRSLVKIMEAKAAESALNKLMSLSQ